MTTGTHDRIITAAMELFAERGYAGTTTRAVAERAGVNEVTLFRRFSSKQGLLDALARRFAEQSLAAGLDELPDPTDCRATLVALAHHEVSTSMRDGGVALRLAFDARSVPEVAALMGDGPRHNLDALASYLAQAQRAGCLRDDVDARVLAEAFSSLTSSFVMYRTVMGFIDTDDDVERTVEQLVDVFWRGVAVPEEGSQ